MLIRIQAGTLPFPSESFLFLDLGYVIKYVSHVGFLFCQFGSGLSPFGTGKGVNCAKFGKGERGRELGLQVCVNYKSQIVLPMSYLIRYNPLRTFLKMVIIKIIIHIAVSNNNKK